MPPTEGVEAAAGPLLAKYRDRRNDNTRSLRVALEILRAPADPESLAKAEHLETKPPGQQFWAEKEEYVRIVRAAKVLPGAALLRDLAERLNPFAQAFRDRLLRLGVVTFDGLLWFARRLLADHRSVRLRLKEHYRRILVDEFQDTDPVQYDILLYLAERPDRFEADPRRVDLEEGKLFLVGDPKQSIYAFRGADIDAYESVRDKVGERRELKRNFRSRPEILDVVNRLFEKLMARPAYIPFEPTRPAGGGVRLVRVPGAARDARRAEAAWIAADIRPPLADTAILLRAFTHLPVYLDALRRRRLPYVVQGGAAFFTSMEIVDLVNLLVAVLNPHDRIALAGFLRSPLAAIDDARLFRAFRGGESDYRRGASDPELAKTYALLAELHAEAARLRPDELLDRALERFHALAVASSTYAGAQAVANVMKLRQLAAAESRRAEFSTREWVRRLRRDALDPPADPESPIADERLNAVRVMTIHAAKGLEFGTVYVPDLHGQLREGGSEIVHHDWEAGRVGIALSKTVRDWAGDELEERLRGRQREEHARLLYVAMTRAKERLVLTGSFERLRGPSFARMVAEALPIEGIEETPYEPPPAARSDAAAEPPVDVDADAVLEAWRRRRERPSRRLFATPSSRVEAHEKGLVADEERRDEAALLGTLVHKVLERADFADLRSGLRERVDRAAALLEGGATAADDAFSMLFAFADSEACRRLARARIVGREIPFAAPDAEGAMVAGRIDLVAEEAGVLWILDYKTGRADSGGYAPQMEAYVRALRALGVEARAAVIQIRSGEWRQA
jgi:ATP-dependent helicase/nuclease subunit A